MSEKRRDNRNRILRNGESQRSDGRYMFKYLDSLGQVKYVYSWRLDKNDRTPPGRKRELSLREKEKQIEADLFDQIVPRGGEMTVLDLVRKYVSLKTGIRHKQERSFLEFIKADSHFSRYYDGIYILFHTGLRISEFVGLTISDLDFENRKINVNHQLQRDRNMNYIIEDTKTSSGTRLVPMMDDVYDCFKRILSARAKPKVEPMIDGYTGFLFLDKNGMPMVALHWEKYFQHIREKYNSIYKVQLPKITPHVCRHTFCSNMAKSGMNPKTLQYIMGHSDIGVTLNTYTHLGFDDVQEEMKRVCNQ